MKPSEASIGSAMVELLAERIAAHTGLHFAGPRLRDLRAALPAMTRDAGLRREADCIGWLLAPPWTEAKTGLCARHLTVGETYFFREPRALELVCDYAAAKFRTASPAAPALRVWSAGCCSGEEPYSIAIALLERFGALDSAQVAILGTDISLPRLQAAHAAVYRPWSLRGTPATVQARHFRRLATGEFQVTETVRALVRLAALNLAGGDFPDAGDDTQRFDIIFCRNVLMYFSKEQARRVIARLRHCLVDGGWLVVSPAEASAELYAGFQAAYFPDGIYFRKVAAGAAGPRHPVPLPPAAAPPAAARQARRAPPMPMPMPMPMPPPAATAHGDDGPDYLEAALRAIEAGDAPAALRALKSELYLRPDAILARYWLGVVQFGQGHYAAAARQFDAVTGCLSGLPDQAVVPGSDAFTVGYLRAAVASFLKKMEEARADIA